MYSNREFQALNTLTPYLVYRQLTTSLTTNQPPRVLQVRSTIS